MAKNRGQKKYSVSYASGATGFGWETEFDTIKEVEECIDDIWRVYSAMVTVYDYELHDFILYKRCLQHKPDKDMLHTWKRDLRTKTREWE